jgi:hypothetical protein
LLRKYQQMLEQGELAPQTNEAANQPGAKQCWGEPVINRAGFFEQADRASPRLNGSAPKFKGKEGKRKQGLLDARLQLSGDEYKQLPAAHDFNNSFIDDATESQFVGRVNCAGRIHLCLHAAQTPSPTAACSSPASIGCTNTATRRTPASVAYANRSTQQLRPHRSMQPP